MKQSNSTVAKRIQKELTEIQKEPIPFITARPKGKEISSNLLKTTWYLPNSHHLVSLGSYNQWT